MTRLQRISLLAFAVFVVLAVALSYMMGATLFADQDKPWHMQPFTDADSLTVEYIAKYELLDRRALLPKFVDSSRVTVSILVDAWGVPFDESLLAEEFAVFKDLPHREFLHRRLAKIMGQVKAIDRMIDEDVPCEDILSQISAAKSALNKAGQVVLEGHINHCIRDAIAKGDQTEIENFTKAIERFANMQ